MKIEIADINSYTKEIKIDVPWDELSDDFEKTYRKFSKKLRIPGFRPGKAPRRVIEKQYGGNIESEFVEDAVQKFYIQAIRDNNFSPVNRPKVKDLHFHKDEHLSFSARFELEPEITLPVLKKNSLKVQNTNYITDEDDLNQAISDLRRNYVEIQTVEDGAKTGDFILADIQKLDESGLPLIGEKLEKRYIKIGEGVFIAENEKKLLGLKLDDTTQINIPDQNGIDSVFEVKVLNVEEEILPEVNDEFVKRIDSTEENVESWKANLRKRIDESFKRRSQEAYDRQLSDAIIEKIDPEYPPSMVKSYLEYILEDVKKTNKSASADDEKIKEIYTPVAERNLKWFLIRKAIIVQENFDIEKEEIQKEIDRLIESSPQQKSEIKKHYKKPSNQSSLADELMEKKIITYLNQFAKVKEVKVKTSDLREQAKHEGHQHV